jgi:hypothetical protein
MVTVKPIVCAWGNSFPCVCDSEHYDPDEERFVPACRRSCERRDVEIVITLIGGGHTDNYHLCFVHGMRAVYPNQYSSMRHHHYLPTDDKYLNLFPDWVEDVKWRRIIPGQFTKSAKKK